jgi:OFA family oxalate/formate antiporter-like MFS transporter
MAATGTWLAVFTIGASMNILAAVLALFVLKPMRMAYTRRVGIADQPSDAGLHGRPVT